MPYWESWIRRDSRFELPSGIAEMLLKPEDVEDRLRRGEDPISLSKEKWERIDRVFAAVSDLPLPLAYLGSLRKALGYKTCGLCIDAVRKLLVAGKRMTTGSDRCKVCRLASIERCTAPGSQFSHLEDVLSMSPLDVAKPMETERLKLISSYVQKIRHNLDELSQLGNLTNR